MCIADSNRLITTVVNIIFQMKYLKQIIPKLLPSPKLILWLEFVGGGYKNDSKTGRLRLADKIEF